MTQSDILSVLVAAVIALAMLRILERAFSEDDDR